MTQRVLHLVDDYTPRDGLAELEQLGRKGPKEAFQLLRIGRGGGLATISRLLRAFRGWRPDRIECWSASTLEWAFLLGGREPSLSARVLGPPQPAKRSMLSRFSPRYESVCISTIDHWHGALWAERFPGARIHVSGGLFDHTTLPSRMNRWEVRSAMGARDDQFVVLCPGPATFQPRRLRDVEPFVATWAAALAHIPNESLTLWLPGWADRGNHLRVFVAGLPDPKMVRFYPDLSGKKPGADTIHTGADLVLFAARRPVCPMPVIRALVDGIPALVSRQSGLAQSGWLRNGENGYVVDKPIPRSFAKALQKIIRERKGDG